MRAVNFCNKPSGDSFWHMAKCFPFIRSLRMFSSSCVSEYVKHIPSTFPNEVILPTLTDKFLQRKIENNDLCLSSNRLNSERLWTYKHRGSQQHASQTTAEEKKNVLRQVLRKKKKNQRWWPAEPEGGAAPAFCHCVASAAIFLMYGSLTVSRMFSGLMSVWMILHLVWR